MTSEDDVADSRLPAYLTRFIGRESELAQLRHLMGAEADWAERAAASGPVSVRLVTVSGWGGFGKTRLALELARQVAGSRSVRGSRFPDGVRWVQLASVAEVGELPRTVAAAFGPSVAMSINPSASLVAEIRDRRLLLVLDNCEQLLEGCRPLVTSVLHACPGVVVLATSRTPLEISEEVVFAVPPLGSSGVVHTVQGHVEDRPGQSDDPAREPSSEAGSLFFDRAEMVTPGYSSRPGLDDTVEAICRRLEGSPLAIELAATWMRVLTPADLLTEIDHGISFLSSSLPTLDARHRSMRAVLQSSWLRLTARERHVLSGLSVFPGDFSREAATGVAGADLHSLSTLAEKSLIQRLPGSSEQSRYHLHQLIKEHAGTQLALADGGRLELARRAHLDHFLAMVDQAQQAWDSAAEQEWLDRLRTEQANIDAALLWALDSGHVEQALRLSAGLFAFWIYTTPLSLFQVPLERALELPWDPRSPETIRARARALNVAGYLDAAARRSDRAVHRFDEGLRLSEQLGDRLSHAWALRGRSYAHRLAGRAELCTGDEERSLEICRELGDLAGESWSLYDLGEIAFALGQLDRAEHLLTLGLQLFEEHGISFGAYRALVMLGDLLLLRGHRLPALDRYAEALARQRQEHFVARGGEVLEGLAQVAADVHRPVAAARLLGAGTAWRKTFGFTRWVLRAEAYERLVTSVRRQLSADRWEQSRRSGEQLTPDQAMEEAQQRYEELVGASTALDAGLTEREREVLQALALGLSNSEIAARLVISPRTVHAHLRSVFEKLEVSSRTAALRRAGELNLV